MAQPFWGPSSPFAIPLGPFSPWFTKERCWEFCGYFGVIFLLHFKKSSFTASLLEDAMALMLDNVPEGR